MNTQMNTQKLSKIIQNKKSKWVENYLLAVYDYLTPSQRKEIKKDLERIKKIKKCQ